MRGRARRYDFDLVLAGEFRGSGEVLETIASHLASLAGSSLQLGLLWLRDPMLPASTPVHARIARLVREHTAVPIPPEIDDLTCRLVLVYEPRLLAAGSPAMPRLRADQRAGGPGAAAAPPGRPGIRRGRGRRRDRGRARPPPALVPRQPDRSASNAASTRPACRLSPPDLPPLEPIAAWRTERNPRGHARPVLGRMLRPDDDRLPAGRDAVAGGASGRARPRDALSRRRGGAGGAGQAVARGLADLRRRRGRRAALPRPARPLRPPPGRAAPPVPARRPPGHGGRPRGGARPRASAPSWAPAPPIASRTRWPRPRATCWPSRASTPATSPSRMRPWPSGSGRSGSSTSWPSMFACRDRRAGAPWRPAPDRILPDQRRRARATSPGSSPSPAGCRRATSRSSSRPVTRWP